MPTPRKHTTRRASTAMRLHAPTGDDDYQALAEAAGVSFAAPAAELHEKLRKCPPAMVRLAHHRGQVAGGLLAYDWGQWFGGRVVPSVGIGLVAVAPEHRAAGLATEMMKAEVRAMAREGKALSALFPANLPLYRRAGYEIAGTRFSIEVETRSLGRRARTLALRKLEPGDHAARQKLYRNALRFASGPIDRSQPVYQLSEKVWRPPYVAYGVWRGKEMVAALAYVNPWKEGKLAVLEMTIADPEAGERVLAFLADHRQQAKAARWILSPQDPIFAALESPEHYRLESRDHWMLRIVDVAAALEARGYPGGVRGRFDLLVRDDVVARNRGRFVLEVDDGEARVRPGGRAAIEIDVRHLASLYTGYHSARQLWQAGWVDATARQVARLEPVFAGPAPYLPDFF